MIKRLSFRVIPIDQLRKMKQRKKDMQERREQFKRFVEKEKAKKNKTL
jgi:hypothetical protein